MHKGFSLCLISARQRTACFNLI